MVFIIIRIKKAIPHGRLKTSLKLNFNHEKPSFSNKKRFVGGWLQRILRLIMPEKCSLVSMNHDFGQRFPSSLIGRLTLGHRSATLVLFQAIKYRRSKIRESFALFHIKEKH